MANAIRMDLDFYGLLMLQSTFSIGFSKCTSSVQVFVPVIFDEFVFAIFFVVIVFDGAVSVLCTSF